ncbi:hypothetical protein HK105_209089 [Polyrhizophydium stewartii]|uniref:Uncharacterized protein n=1 Tax=Polyrhizophydium stewartii TaxID=2732419 RepID=A0ABR4MW05_9FUNG|nr:hypothetical protein HK105_006140 [Polyrhizophydium stewartii]
MAGGSPFEIYNVFGLKVPRYQLAGYTLAAYFGIYFTVSTINSFKPPKPITYESPAEEDYVKRYIHYAHEEAKKPVLLRAPFTGSINN